MAMDVKITPDGGSAVRLCMLPEKIKYGGKGKFMTYDIISLGDIKIPRGSSMDEIEWSGIFPGEAKKNAPFVKKMYYRKPKDYIKLFRTWRDKGTKCNLLVTSTGLNMDVYVDQFSVNFSGGLGDVEYTVKFVRARTITISNKAPSSSAGSDSRESSREQSQQTTQQNQTTRTYTVVHGDYLWRIAEQYLGNGARYPEIYQLNKAQIDALGMGPNAICSGMVLTLPAC